MKRQMDLMNFAGKIKWNNLSILSSSNIIERVQMNIIDMRTFPNPK